MGRNRKKSVPSKAEISAPKTTSAATTAPTNVGPDGVLNPEVLINVPHYIFDHVTYERISRETFKKEDRALHKLAKLQTLSDCMEYKPNPFNKSTFSLWFVNWILIPNSHSRQSPICHWKSDGLRASRRQRRIKQNLS